MTFIKMLLITTNYTNDISYIKPYLVIYTHTHSAEGRSREIMEIDAI